MHGDLIWQLSVCFGHKFRNVVALSFMISDTLVATLTIQHEPFPRRNETFPLGDPVWTYQTGSSPARGPKGPKRNPHSSFAACSPPDRKRMRQNNAPVRTERRTHGAVDTSNAAASWIAPAGTSSPYPRRLQSRRTEPELCTSNIFCRE